MVKMYLGESNRLRSYIDIAILGCGWVCEAVHLPALVGHPDVEITGIYDSSAHRATEMSKKFGIRRFASAEDLLQSPADAVLIATPPSSHFRLIRAALHANKNVVCEKSLALPGVPHWRKPT